jgi:uncharacterized protein YegP (UPF0339 family)
MFNLCKPKFRAEMYRDANFEWRWRVRSTANGNITASSAGDGYKNYYDCLDMLKKQIKWNIPIIDIEA